MGVSWKKAAIYKKRNHHFVFGPILVRVHYAKAVLQWLELTGFEIFPYHFNPPNIPQARPNEKFWAIRKTKYTERKRVVKNRNSFKTIWELLSVTSESSIIFSKSRTVPCTPLVLVSPERVLVTEVVCTIPSVFCSVESRF